MEGMREWEALVPLIDECAGRLQGLRDAELRRAAATVRVSDRASLLESGLPDAFALASEAFRRVTGERPVSAQLVAGAALHFGMVADVKDGEGKNVVTMLAAMVDAFAGRVVHVVSVNDYLARRDAEWARPVGELVGLRVGLVVQDMDTSRRQGAYRADLTYGSASEFVYDYLRDNIASHGSELVQRGQDCAFVDDIDSVLIDGCRNDCTISTPADDEAVSWTRECARLAKILRPGTHYHIHPESKVISLTDAGAQVIEDELPGANVFDDDLVIHEVRAALRVRDDWRRGREYDVVDGRIVLLDSETGMASGGRWFGSRMQRALEAKEDLLIREPLRTVARTTVRGYFRHYRKLAGLSGSAAVASEAFKRIYGLDTVEIPTILPNAREDHDDRIFRTSAQMYDAVLAAILERRETGQPVIVGAATARGAQQVVRQLTGVDIPCRVADGRDPAQDADTIAAAARTGAVTVVTEQACLGNETGLDRLAVLGIGRHRSRRHDDRLRGLAGRAGTSGECTFFLSLDNLVEDGSVDIDLPLDPLPESVADGLPSLTALVEQLQREREARSLRALLGLGEYDEVWEDQCRDYYALRRVLRSNDHPGMGLLDLVYGAVDDVIATYDLTKATTDRKRLDNAVAAIRELYPTRLTSRQLQRGSNKATITNDLRNDARRAYQKRCAQLSREPGVRPEHIPALERMVLLTSHDRQWQQHLLNMEALYDDMFARPLNGPDKISAFRREAHVLFQRWQHNTRRDATELFFHLTFGTPDN
jgi:preprotein translocase subunit SecA